MFFKNQNQKQILIPGENSTWLNNPHVVVGVGSAYKSTAGNVYNLATYGAIPVGKVAIMEGVVSNNPVNNTNRNIVFGFRNNYNNPAAYLTYPRSTYAVDHFGFYIANNSLSVIWPTVGASLGTVNVGDKLSIKVTGRTFEFFKNDVLIRTVTIGIEVTLYPSMLFYTYGAMSNIKTTIF